MIVIMDHSQGCMTVPSASETAITGVLLCEAGPGWPGPSR